MQFKIAMTLTIASLIYLPAFGDQGTFPRLVPSVRPPRCVESLESPSPTEEILNLFQLSHPLVIKYLEDRHSPTTSSKIVKSTDLYLLVLLFGDQSAFDFRTSAPSNFKSFERALDGWMLKSVMERDSVVDRWLASFAAPTWRFSLDASLGTLFLDRSCCKNAFLDDKHTLFGSPYQRQWDVNDRENVSLRLHERIIFLRELYRNDPVLQTELHDLLSRRFARTNLPHALKTTRVFLRQVSSWMDAQPNAMRDLAKRLKGKYSIGGGFKAPFEEPSSAHFPLSRRD